LVAGKVVVVSKAKYEYFGQFGQATHIPAVEIALQDIGFVEMQAAISRAGGNQ